MDTATRTPEAWIEDLQRQLADNPECAVTQYNLGTAYVAAGRFEEAATSFLAAVSIAPDMAEAYVQLGGLAMRTGDLDGCFDWNQKARQLRPDFAVPWGNLGFVHLQRAEVDLAEAALRKAISLDGQFVQALATLASTLFMKGDLDEAEATCRKVLALQPGFGPAWNNLALVALERGEHKAALEYLEKAAATGFAPHPDLVAEVKAVLAGDAS